MRALFWSAVAAFVVALGFSVAHAALSAVIVAGGSSIVTESIPNGRLDAGELVTVSLCLTNTGTATSGGVTGTLAGTGGVLSPSGPQSYGAVPVGGIVCRSYSFTVGSACGSAVTATLQTNESGAGTVNVPYTFEVGTPAPAYFSQTFDGVTAPSLPTGWTTALLNGTSNAWVVSTTNPDTPLNRVFAADPASLSDNVLISPTFAVQAGSRLTFRNFYNTESGADGGVLEIAINGAGFQDIIAAGGNFVSGGYNAPLGGANPIAGRPAWTGNSGSYVTTTVLMPAAAFGQNAVLRWRMTTDTSTAGTGWSVDTISVYTIMCGNTPPTISSISGKATPANTPITVNFTVGDVESGPSGVIVTGSSSNTTLVPNGNLAFGGTGTSRTAIITPAANRTGSTTITLTASDGTSTVSTSFELSVGTPIFPGDFDGDAKSDITVFRPSNGTWYTINSNTGSPSGFVWGNGNDRPVPADYDGDGKTDFAVFRPTDGGWYIMRSSTGTPLGVVWGSSTDVPVPGDYDGDRKTDVAVFRPSNGTWFVLPSTTGVPFGFVWGNGQDIPVPADYDGDGKTDIAIFRPSNGTWFVVPSTTGTPYGFVWGNAADKPVAADYDGDGRADIAVFRPYDGAWFIVNSSTGTPSGIGFGGNADIPVPGDFDGDRKTDIAIFRPSNGTWFVLPSSTGVPYGLVWGSSTDIPILKRP